MKKYDSIEIVKIIVHSRSGANIASCIIDAAHLSIENQVNVELIHNKKYRIDFNDIMCAAKEIKEEKE